MKRTFALDTCVSIDSAMESQPPESLTPEKLPDPWLADSEWLLEELAKTRQAVLRVPFALNSASDIKSVIDRIWSLEETLRYLLRLHREGQRSFARKAAKSAASKDRKAKTIKVIQLRA